MVSWLRNKVAWLRGVHSSHGWREVARLLWAGTWHRGGNRLFLFALSQPRPLPLAVQAARNHTFRFATVEDLERIRSDPAAAVSEEDVARAGSGAIRCLLQLDGEALVGFTWVWGSPLAHLADGFHINLPDDTAYNYKEYTAPAYRGQGFQALRHLELLRALEPEGVRRLLCSVHHFNTSSLRGVRKSGFEPVGEFRITAPSGRVRMVVETTEELWVGDSRT